MSCLVYPFFKARSVLMYPFVSGLTHAQSVSTLQQTIEELQLANQNLQENVIRLESLRLFTQETEEVIEFAKRYDHEHKKLVKVLMSTVCEKEDALIVDSGKNHGIQKDDVVVYKNMLIGRVIEVYPCYSKVALITDKRCKISAQCQAEVVGIFCGKNNGQAELNFIPHFKEIAVGEMILSTGNGLVYPQGFALGEVVSIQTDNVSHHIQAKTLLDLSALSYVYIFTK